MARLIPKIMDVCCGSRMFWFNKEHPDCVYMDERVIDMVACDGRKVVVKPDIVGDFRNNPFPNECFKMVVFDPPHLIRAGEKSWLAQKYGRLNKDTWKDDLKLGFSECFRILEPYGFLIFKWNEDQIKLGDVLKLCDIEPLFGNRHSKTHWLVFMKPKP